MSGRAVRKFERMMISIREAAQHLPLREDGQSSGTTVGHVQYDFLNQIAIFTPVQNAPDKETQQNNVVAPK